jgi:hypothetical protein
LPGGLYYSWSKEFLEAGKRRLAGDTARAATSDEVKNPYERGKVPGVVVQRDSGAVSFPKVSGWRRYVGRLIRKRAA